MAHEIDETDKKILHLFQDDARKTTSDIADEVGVSPSTASKRIKKLEQSDIIKGYHPDISYETAGFTLNVLFVCTTPITDRENLIQEILGIPGVINVMELMTGDNNIHIQVVGRSNDDISELAYSISELDIQINEEVLIKNEYHTPASVFK